MKTKITFFIVLCIFAINSTHATQIPVTTVTEFTNALSAYVAGDTLLISEGTYDLSSSSRTITKDITILANPSATLKPKVKAQWSLGGNCSFAMEGIEAYYDLDKTTNTSAYFLQAVAGIYNMASFSLKNCYIHGYGRALLRADNATNIPTITNLVVSNCIIADLGRSSAGYSVFAVKYGKISNVSIINTTVYDCFNGFWYTEVTTFPITFNMEKCCILKSTSSGSKLLFNANTNTGSTYTIKDCIISDSNDGTTTNMQLKLSAHTNNIDNVIFGNNINATKFLSSTLAVDNQVAVTSFTYDYATLTLNIGATTSNIGDPRWTINNVSTGKVNPTELQVKIYSNNGNLHLENLPAYARINVYSVNGKQLIAANAVASTMSLPLKEKLAIVRVESQGVSKTVKLGF